LIAPSPLEAELTGCFAPIFRPNPMLLGHQDWLDGLVKAVREKVASSV
jgi:hypothetical protein